jgi:predicted phosphodiesterase
VNWLRVLPGLQWIGKTICAIHGTPDSDTVYLLEDIQAGHIAVKKEPEIEKSLLGIGAKIILCGHSHTCRLIQTKTRLIINPGSVGLQAFEDDTPVYHTIESNNNSAQYHVLDIDGSEITSEQISIPYDYENAVRCAISHNRPDWAKWLKYGKA